MNVRADADAGLPKTASVVIIGGGIVGCSAAYFLAKRGLDVVLCEKGRIAGEQSSRNWGWVRQQGRDPAEIPLMMESCRIWQGLEAEIGEDLGFAVGGCLYLARDDDDRQKHQAWLDKAKAFQLDSRLLTSDQVKDLTGSAGGNWEGSLYTPSDGRAEPAKAAPAIARAAAARGATVLTNCAVRGLEIASGRVAGVVTELGTIQSDTVVCAGGVWTSLFGHNHGLSIPQLRVKGTVARTGPAPEVTKSAVWLPEVTLRPRQDGGYTVAHGSASLHFLGPDTLRFFSKFLPTFKEESERIRLRIGPEAWQAAGLRRRWRLDERSPFEATRTLDPSPSQSVLKEIRRNLDRTYPALAAVPFVETWAGMIEASPDQIPFISPVERYPGFFLASGFSGHGFGIGPGAGRLIADMVTDRASASELAPFRFSRFSDGSDLSPKVTH